MGWMAAASLAVSAASSFLGNKSAKKSAKAAKKAAKKQEKLAKAQYALTKQWIDEDKETIRQNTVQQLSEYGNKAQEYRSSIIATAAESGVAGVSVSSQLLSAYWEESQARGKLIRNYDLALRDKGREEKDAKLKADAAIISSAYSGPSSTTLALSSGLNLASNILSINRQTDGDFFKDIGSFFSSG